MLIFMRKLYKKKKKKKSMKIESQKFHYYQNEMLFSMVWGYLYHQQPIGLPVFQLDFGIFRTIVNFIKISSGHSLIMKLIFFRTI